MIPLPSNETVFAALFWFGLVSFSAAVAKRMLQAWANGRPSRASLALENVKLRSELEQDERYITSLKGERDYWKARAERFIDIGLAQKGAVHEPVMSGEPTLDQIAQIPGFQGAGVMEFDSTKPDGRVP